MMLVWPEPPLDFINWPETLSMTEYVMGVSLCARLSSLENTGFLLENKYIDTVNNVSVRHLFLDDLFRMTFIMWILIMTELPNHLKGANFLVNLRLYVLTHLNEFNVGLF